MLDVFIGADAALAHQTTILWYSLSNFNGVLQPGFERAQIAIVDANHSGAAVEH
jgi:hypothetical protein